MQPLKLVLPGQYWDTQIYAGRLYLFGVQGDILTLDWESLVRELQVQDQARLALFCAFLRSDYLYGAEVQELLHDSEVRHLVRSKFALLEGAHIEVTPTLVSRHELGHQDNPCPFPHADTEIYYRNLYVGGPSGIFRATATGRTKYPISTRPDKLWDAPVLGMSASWGRLALAAGDEGLFEIVVPTGRDGWEADSLSTNSTSQPVRHSCLACNWNYHSVFGSTRTGGFLADYEKEEVGGRQLPRRHLKSIVRAEALFEEVGYSWGVQDKLFSFGMGGIRVIRYSPWKEEHGERFQWMGTVPTARWKGEVVAASAAPFGMVVEFDRALVIFPSRGQARTLKGEPVNWRIFPRSKYYENQLHVIYDDHLEVLSFNHDYLVDQEEKLKGTTVRLKAPAGGHLFGDA